MKLVSKISQGYEVHQKQYAYTVPENLSPGKYYGVRIMRVSDGSGASVVDDGVYSSYFEITSEKNNNSYPNKTADPETKGSTSKYPDSNPSPSAESKSSKLPQSNLSGNNNRGENADTSKSVDDGCFDAGISDPKCGSQISNGKNSKSNRVVEDDGNGVIGSQKTNFGRVYSPKNSASNPFCMSSLAFAVFFGFMLIFF
ncbi:hypothetical protein AYI68_g5239 [Smittium mucronatum]|uniref:Uncharacterized protein n=1 Tax=Smittium mucronatum TaxID=133383 RepID=A0A1R0GUU4_9FUNG|nr:hypothetical protein AYI68_g5239 [Smittium mucronatum]